MRYLRDWLKTSPVRISGIVRRGILAALMVGVCLDAAGQSDRGAIAGSILDSSGAVVPGATITATGADTGIVYKTTSTSEGVYRIPNIQVGAYNITVEAPGFKTSEQKGLIVQINTTAALDVVLQPGEVKETVTVVAKGPTLQTETSDMGTVVDKRQIVDLPLAVDATGQSYLRSPEAFVFLTPGTAGPGTADSSSGIFQSKLAGGQEFGNEVILDGASTARADSGSAFDQTAPSVEALDEFKVMTSTLPAQFGRTTGGAESFTTKSGSNTFHGTAYDIFRNTALDANPWFNNLYAAPVPLDQKNDYGGDLGGPVWIPKVYNGRDKTFFFFSWEQYRQTLGSTNVSTIPTAAERQGDFSSLVNTSDILGTNPCDGSTIYQGQIFDPSTTKTVNGVQCRTAFPGNKISKFSNVAQKILGFFPPPTDSGYINNFIYTTHNPILDTTMSFRIDQNLSPKSKLFFSYTSRDQEALASSPVLPNPIDTNYFHSFFTHYVRVGWDYFLSPTVLEHFNVGLNRIYSNSVATSVNGTDWDSAIGLTGAHGPTFPPISFAGGHQNLTSIGSPNADADVPNSLVVADSLSWTKGRHSLSFGIDLRAFQFSVLDQSHDSPSLGFDFSQTAGEPTFSGAGLTGDPFASFLLGATQSWSLAVRSEQPRFVSSYYAGFVQDDFKVRRNLMLNIGLRYEVETPRHEATGADSVFSPTAPNPGAIGPNGPLLGALIFGGTGPGRSGSAAIGATTYYRDFGPRIGFSYAPESSSPWLRQTVFRGGYAIYYAPLTYGDFGQSLTDGFTASPSGSANFVPTILLDSGIPSYPPPPNLDPAQDNGGFGGGFGGPTYIAPSYGRPGMVENWSLELQRQLTPDLILSVGYLGSHGTHLRSLLGQINALNPKYFTMGNTLNLLVTDPASPVPAPFTQFVPLYGGAATVAQALLPFPQYMDIDSDCCLENLGMSTYNALLAKVERRFRNGLNLLASYTFSKTLTDADSALPAFAGFSGGGYGQNPYNLKGEKSLSYQDIPHTFVLSYLYELPVGPGKKFVKHGGAVGKVLGGWEVGGVQRYQSGQPLVFGCATGVPGFSSYLGPCIRYDQVRGQPLLSSTASSFNVGNVALLGGTGCTENANGTFSAPAGATTYFNCAAFVDPNAPALVASRGYAFGAMPRVIGNVRSQPFVNEDFSIMKSTAISESRVLIFKAEFVNAFNRHVFTRPDTGLTDGGFGTSYGTVDSPRNIQFTLRFQF
jgi:hypothetical protein